MTKVKIFALCLLTLAACSKAADTATDAAVAAIVDGAASLSDDVTATDAATDATAVDAADAPSAVTP